VKIHGNLETQNGSGFYGRATVQTFKEAESSVLEFTVVGPYGVSK